MKTSPGSKLAALSSFWLLLLAGCGANPAIQSFKANPAQIEVGGSATLTWNVIDAETVTISGVGERPASDKLVTVTPTETTTYTLTATNEHGTSQAEPVTVTVLPRFDAAAGRYLDGANVGSTFAFAMRELGGGIPAGETTVTLGAPGGGTSTHVCPGGKALCLLVQPTVAPVPGQWTASATVGGQARTETFSLGAGARQDKANPVFAQRTSTTTAVATWGAAAGAASYRVGLLDGSGQPASPAQVVTGTSATLTSTGSIDASTFKVAVEASAVDLNGEVVSFPLASPNISRAVAALGGDPNRYRLYGGASFSGNTLTAAFEGLGPTERVAVIVLNVDGSDYLPDQPENNVALSVTGTLAFPRRELQDDGEWSLPMALIESPRAAAFRGHDRIRDLEQAAFERGQTASLQPAVAASAPAVLPVDVPATASFCVAVEGSSTLVRRSATLRRQSAHVAFYVDDGDLGNYSGLEPGIWDTLQSRWEGTTGSPGIYGRVTGAFGPESDVDQNGKLLVFFSSQLGPGTGGGIILGYFFTPDTLYAKDTTASCNGNTSGSNAADMFYLNDINNIANALNLSTSEVINTTYPDTLAHEFQHLINTNAHCILQSCSSLEHVWLNEGLSMVAEDVAGFGWNASVRDQRYYLDRLPPPAPPRTVPLGYHRRSLTTWERDPVGNYEGSHSFVRYWADRYGEGILRQLVSGGLEGVDHTEAVLGLPFAQQLADWTTALMFSNETFSPGPQFDFTGAAWTPFHQDVAYVNYVKLSSTANGQVRRSGWNAFLTGLGTGGTATITVTSADPVKPHVVMVRFAGTLPQCNTGTPGVDGSCWF